MGTLSAALTYQTISATLLVLAVVGLAKTSRAEDLSGTWKASPLQVSWAVGDWGKACGPRPGGGAEPGGVVQITSTGSMGFTLQGLGRTYSSGQCWEQMPGLSPRGKTLSSTTIQTTCRMPTGDPRQAKVVTSWYPRGNEIYFDEAGQYQFVVSGSNCTASVRRTRVFSRVVDTPAAPLDDPSPTSQRSAQDASNRAPTTSGARTPERPPTPERSSRCARPGEPVSAEITPKSKLMRSGESFRFEAVARDAAGCRVPIPTHWKLQTATPGVSVDQDGRLQVQKDAPPGQLTLLASIGRQQVEVGARIVNTEEYEALIAGGTYGAQGESLEAATVQLASNHVEFEKPIAPRPQEFGGLRWALVGALGAILAGLAAFIWKGRRTGRPPAANSVPTAGESSARDTPEEQTPRRLSEAQVAMAATQAAGSAPALFAPSAERETPRRLCPVCGRRYDSATVFCVEDGARLMRMN